jgi:putative sterol carrier protein
MPRFPSPAWATAFQSAVNANAEYASAAKAWEGDVLLLVTADATAPNGEGVHLDLAHGTCRAATYTDQPSAIRAEFVYEGRRESWTRLMHREVEPVRAILDGTFKVRGNMAKALRFTQAAKALVETAAAIPESP